MGRHQLQIVDDDHADAVVALQSPRLGSGLQNGDPRRVIDVDRGLRQSTDVLRQVDPVFFVESPRAQLVQVDTRLNTQQPLGQLQFGHFQTEESDTDAVLHSGTAAEGQGQSRLAHTRSSGKDDQIAVLKT